MLRFFKAEDRTLKRDKSIGVFVVYIDTGSSMPISPLKSRDLADENNKILTEWKWFETTVLTKTVKTEKYFLEIVLQKRQYDTLKSVNVNREVCFR
jgi:hypothetical protein